MRLRDRFTIRHFSISFAVSGSHLALLAGWVGCIKETISSSSCTVQSRLVLSAAVMLCGFPLSAVQAFAACCGIGGSEVLGRRKIPISAYSCVL